MSADLGEDIEMELELLAELLRTSKALRDEISSGKAPSTMDLFSLGGVLHSFYNGLENVFKRVACQLRGFKSSGADWHVELLELVASPPLAVVSPDLAEKLREYMRFRHLFRHAYGFQLKWEGMAPLVRDIEAIEGQVRQQLQSFVARLPRVDE